MQHVSKRWAGVLGAGLMGAALALIGAPAIGPLAAQESTSSQPVPNAAKNSSFEQTGEDVPEWAAQQGARNDAAGGVSVGVVDRTQASAGSASLRLEGDRETSIWNLRAQVHDIVPEQRVLLTFRARSRGVQREGKQFPNSNALFLVHDASGQRIGFQTSFGLWGDRDWATYGLHQITPKGASRLTTAFFLSCTGRLWIDDVVLRVQPARPTTRAARGLAVDALELHLRTTYPFWGIAGRPEPDALFGKHRSALLAAKDEESFLNAVHALLSDLQDVHVSLQTKAGVRPTVTGTTVPLNRDDGAILAQITSTVATGPHWFVGRIGEGKAGIGYVSLNSLVFSDEAWRTFEHAFDRLAGVKCVVLDVRRNGGGAEVRAQRLLGRFASKPVLYARHRFRDPGSPGFAGFQATQDRTLQPLTGSPFNKTRLIVLQGPHCVSSGEGLVAMAGAIPGSTTVGLPTRGASGNPGPFPLWPGAAVHASRWQSLDLEGHCTEGKGVPPDVVIPHKPTKALPDPAFTEALRLARAK